MSTYEKSFKEEAVRLSDEIGVKQAYIQEGGTARESFIPEFMGEGVHHVRLSGQSNCGK